MKTLTKLKMLCLTTTVSLGFVPQVQAAPGANDVPFTVSSQSVVPGAVLAPGSYTLHVVNRLSDRVILNVKDASGAVSTTFLGVESPSVGRKAGGGAVMWPNQVDGTEYMKGWSFAGSKPVEFVYPKDAAVKIATANPAKVPAVDPASEGKPADNTITQGDMQLLNLWLLHLDKVGTEGGGIKAEHYQLASAPKPKPVVAALPHTASMLPTVWMAGAFSLMTAGLLRLARKKRDAAAEAA